MASTLDSFSSVEPSSLEQSAPSFPTAVKLFPELTRMGTDDGDPGDANDRAQRRRSALRARGLVLL